VEGRSSEECLSYFYGQVPPKAATSPRPTVVRTPPETRLKCKPQLGGTGRLHELYPPGGARRYGSCPLWCQRTRARGNTRAPRTQETTQPDQVLYYPIEYEPLLPCQFATCPPPVSWRSRLSAVAKCSTDDVCTWKRTFTWQHDSPTFFAYDAPVGPLDPLTLALVVLDLDGDGADDILYQAQGAEGVPYKVTHARFGGPTGLGPEVVVSLTSNIPNMNVSIDELQLLQSRPIDVDRDGASELYATFVRYSSSTQQFYQYHALLRWGALQGGSASPMGLVTAQPVTFGLFTLGPTADIRDTVRVADLDGDGLPNVLRNEDGFYIYQKNLGGILGSDTATGVAASCFARTRVVDLDGDGKGQLLGFDLGPNETACTASRGLGLGDNGLFSPSSKWKLAALPIADERPGVVLADINGDGLADAVYPSGVSPIPEIAWNTGNGFGPKEPISWVHSTPRFSITCPLYTSIRTLETGSRT
jgi:hypothetical protein